MLFFSLICAVYFYDDFDGITQVEHVTRHKSKGNDGENSIYGDYQNYDPNGDEEAGGAHRSGRAPEGGNSRVKVATPSSKITAAATTIIASQSNKKYTIQSDEDAKQDADDDAAIAKNVVYADDGYRIRRSVNRTGDSYAAYGSNKGAGGGTGGAEEERDFTLVGVTAEHTQSKMTLVHQGAGGRQSSMYERGGMKGYESPMRSSNGNTEVDAEVAGRYSEYHSYNYNNNNESQRQSEYPAASEPPRQSEMYYNNNNESQRQSEYPAASEPPRQSEMYYNNVNESQRQSEYPAASEPPRQSEMYNY